MRILHDFQIFTAQRRGGISRYHLELLRSLARIPGIEPELFLGLHESDASDALADTGLRRGIRLKTPRFPGRFRINQRLLERRMRRGGYAIYHPTYYRVLAHAERTRVALTVHDMIHELFPQFMTAGDPTVELRRSALPKADVILCVSENTKRDFVSIYREIGDKPMVVTPLASGLSGTPSGRRWSERPAILFVGPRHGYKNFKVLSEAWVASAALHLECALVCLGGEPPTDEERALPGEVRWLRGDDQLAVDLYASARLLVYPSKYEGFGMPILEAMQFGCPVVASRGGSIPEVAGGAAEYVAADDAEELAAAIVRVRDDTAVRDRLIAEGRERASQFTWDRCAARTLEAYRLVAD